MSKFVVPLLCLAVPSLGIRVGEQSDEELKGGESQHAHMHVHGHASQHGPGIGGIVAASQRARKNALANQKKYADTLEQMKPQVMAELESLRELIPSLQSGSEADLEQCVGNGGTMPNKQQTYSKSAAGIAASPSGIFQFDPAEYDFALKICAPTQNVNGYCMNLGLKEDALQDVLDPEPPFTAPQCCGKMAKMFVVRTEAGQYEMSATGRYKYYAKLRCLGLTLGEECRLSSTLGGLFASQTCGDGLKCEPRQGEQRSMLFGGTTTGVCVSEQE